MKFGELINKKIYVQDYLVGSVRDVYVDEDWGITHLEVALTKEASKEFLGARTSFRNMLAVSALGKWPDCCTEDRINLSVSKGQLKIYLRPPK